MTVATIGGAFFLGFVWLLALGWLWQLWQWLSNFPSLVDLTQIPHESLPALPVDSGDTPQLTVIVPACNEEVSIEATLRSLLASEEIRLQILAVDDRSTDRTGEIMEQVAAEASTVSIRHTLQVLHIRELPSGWLGKPHALATAAQSAQSEWILCTDADVLFAPRAASLALGYALAVQADHLILMPDWTMKSHGEAAMHGALHALSTWTLRLWRVADPAARDSLGVGAFNLIRRSAYEALGGFAALRMEVLEDLRFGRMLKRSGYRQRVVLGPGLAAVRWSRGAWGVVRNLEKNLFALYRYNIVLTLFACLGLAVQITLPLAAIIAGGTTRLAGIVTYTAIAGLYVASRKVTRVPPVYVLVYPLAASLFLFAMLRSMILVLVRGGVIWRGTLYSLKDLRANTGRFW